MWDGQGFYCLRYRETVAEWRAAGFDVPPILITETGIDGGVIGQDHAKQGWAEFTDHQGYLDQLAWYSEELDKDSQVEAATVFTVCSWDWHSFNVPEDLGMALAAYVRDHPSPIPEPEPEPEPELPEFYDAEGNRRDAAWAEHFFGPLGIHCPDVPAAWRLIELREVRGDTPNLTVTVLGPNVGIPVALFPVTVSGDTLEGVTNDAGQVMFTLSEPHKIYPPAPGNYGVAVVEDDSDVWNTAGYVQTPEHKRWLNPTFAFVDNGEPEPEPEPEPDPEEQAKIFDGEGIERDVAWLTDRYGPVQVIDDGGEYWLAEIHEDTSGQVSVIVTVLDVDGKPVQAVPVKWGWPDGQIEALTGADGKVSFSMGGGAYYYPPESGPHYVVVDRVRVNGLGMLGETEHHHLNLVYRERRTGHRLTLEFDGQGTVEIDPVLDEYADGQQVTLFAQPATDWEFLEWTVNGSQQSTQNPVVVTMLRDAHVVARFVQPAGVPDIEAAIEAGEAALAQIEAALAALRGTA